jgi:hypothetical protein
MAELVGDGNRMTSGGDSIVSREREQAGLVDDDETRKLWRQLDADMKKAAEGTAQLMPSVVRLALVDAWTAYIRQVEKDAEALAWFYRMVESGGPDSSDLDYVVSSDAQLAANRVLVPSDEAHNLAEPAGGHRE